MADPPLIPKRSLTVRKNSLKPLEEIQEWVQEQGVAMGSEHSIIDAAKELEALWEQIPNGSTCVKFEKSSDKCNDAGGLPRYKVTHQYKR
jgi:hypothetical protein